MSRWRRSTATLASVTFLLLGSATAEAETIRIDISGGFRSVETGADTIISLTDTFSGFVQFKTTDTLRSFEILGGVSGLITVGTDTYSFSAGRAVATLFPPPGSLVDGKVLEFTGTGPSLGDIAFNALVIRVSGTPTDPAGVALADFLLAGFVDDTSTDHKTSFRFVDNSSSLFRDADIALTQSTILRAGPFRQGELYLISPSLPTIGDGILRIDAATGASFVLADLSGSVRPTLTWDRFRDRLLGADGAATGGLMAIDALGTVTFPAPALSTPHFVAARGDGIVYLWTPSLPIRYLDAAGAPHDLLDLPGTGSYTVSAHPAAMIYEPASNALFLFQDPGIVSTLCTDFNMTCVVKVPLTADGTRVAAVETFAEVDVSTGAERPSGVGYAPGGQLLVAVDTNSNEQEPRMLLLDPATLVFSTWASNGPYTGAATTNAGTYSSVRGQAVILDTFANSLRAYSFGETGNGTLFGSGLSDTGFGEFASMVEIHALSATPLPALGASGLLLLAVSVVAAGVALRRRSTPIGRPRCQDVK